MTRARSRVHDPLDARFDVRVTLAEHARLAAAAKDLGLTLSAHVRQRVTGGAPRARSPRAADDAIAAAIRESQAELRRLGGLLKLLYATSGGASGPQSAALLRQIGAAIDTLAAAI